MCKQLHSNLFSDYTPKVLTFELSYFLNAFEKKISDPRNQTILIMLIKIKVSNDWDLIVSIGKVPITREGIMKVKIKRVGP